MMWKKKLKKETGKDDVEKMMWKSSVSVKYPIIIQDF